MKMIKLTALALMLIILCGCQAKPEPTEPVPTFGEPVIFETQPEGETQPDTRQAVLSDTFQSADGTVEFNFRIDEQLDTKDLRILEAVPRPITGEDAKRLAELVFPESTFYDQEPQSSKLYSKEEVERYMELYTKYSDLGALTELYGADARDWSVFVAQYREFWEKQLKKARDENPHKLCDWEFKSDTYYYDLEDRDGEYWDEIYAVTQKGDVQYLVAAYHSSDPDNRVQKLNISVHSLYGDFLSHRLGWHSLVAGDKPTEADMEAAKKQTQDMLDRLGIGQWQVSEARVEDGPAGGSYIAVAADFILDGQRIPRETGGGDGWWASQAYIGLTVDGEITAFELALPMELKGTVTDRPDLLSLADVLAQMKEKLAGSTAADQFGRNIFPLHFEEQKAGEPLICKVDISNVEYTMARMKAPDDADTFYYYPVLTFTGTANYYGKNSGALHITTEEAPLFTVNTLNGELTVH